MKRNIILPVNGAATYFADYDEGRPAVWMMIPKDENCNEDRYYVLSHHREMDIAERSAEKWQTKENKSVLKHYPELNP